MFIKFILNILLLSSLFVNLNADSEFIPSKNEYLAVEYLLEETGQEVDKKFFQFTKDLENIGFWVNDAHHNVNKVYKKLKGNTSLDQLSFSSMINDDIARPLFNLDPRLGAFTPFNLVIYRKLNDNKTVITHILPEAALDILQISNKDVRNKFIKMFKPLDNAIEKTFKSTKRYTKLHRFAKKGMINFEIPFETPEDIDDFFDDFQEKFERAFEQKGYIIAGFYNMKYSLNSEEDVLENFEQYAVWSLCHISFSYTIFDGEKPFPQAAVFAPCSLYAYIKAGENKIIIGMPTLNAWAAALNITDKDKLIKINQLDIEIPLILQSLGAKKST